MPSKENLLSTEFLDGEIREERSQEASHSGEVSACFGREVGWTSTFGAILED